MSHCTGCKHLAPGYGECQELIWKAICGQCLSVYAIADRRCPRCLVASTTPAGTLQEIDGVFQRSAYCPLTKVERKRLDEKQASPVERKTQGELF